MSYAGNYRGLFPRKADREEELLRGISRPIPLPTLPAATRSVPWLFSRKRGSDRGLHPAHAIFLQSRRPSINKAVAAHPVGPPANSSNPPKEPERVENFVTAKSGQVTYRVIAYRKMEKGELQRVVWDALQSGKLKEPEPGGTATLVTDIGELWPKVVSD